MEYEVRRIVLALGIFFTFSSQAATVGLPRDLSDELDRIPGQTSFVDVMSPEVSSHTHHKEFMRIFEGTNEMRVQIAASEGTQDVLARTTIHLEGEKSQVVVAGRYLASIVTQDKQSLLLAVLSDRLGKVTIYHCRFASDGYAALEKTSWSIDSLDQAGEVGFAELSEHEYVFSGIGQPKNISIHGMSLNAEDIVLQSDWIHEDSHPIFKELGGRLFVVFSNEVLKTEKRSYFRNFIAPVLHGSVDSRGVWTHGTPINIPGWPLATLPTGQLLARGSWLVDEIEGNDVLVDALLILNIVEDRAVLLDTIKQ